MLQAFISAHVTMLEHLGNISGLQRMCEDSLKWDTVRNSQHYLQKAKD